MVPAFPSSRQKVLNARPGLRSLALMAPSAILVESTAPTVIALLLMEPVATVWAGSSLAGWADLAVFATRVRMVERTPDTGPRRSATLEFPYRGSLRRLTVRVADSYAEAARELRTSAVFGSEGRLQTAHVATLIQVESDSRFVGDLARELRRLRNDLGLDSDEYVELMARAVQSIPYGTPDWQIGLPVTVVLQRQGVCTDKSVLLASLLLHEGYDTAVWVFDSQRHAAVGIRGVGPGFAGTPYSFIETTREAFVNEYDDALVARGTYIKPPQLIQVGGQTRYTADVQATYIADTLQRSRESSVSLAPYRRYAERAADPWRATYAALAQEHESATRLVAWIREHGDDRALVFRTLTSGISPR